MWCLTVQVWVPSNELLLHWLWDLLLTALSQFWSRVSCMYFPSLMLFVLLAIVERRPVGGLQVVESSRHLQALWDLDMKGYMRRKCPVNLRGSEWPSSYFCVHGGLDWTLHIVHSTYWTGAAAGGRLGAVIDHYNWEKMESSRPLLQENGLKQWLHIFEVDIYWNFLLAKILCSYPSKKVFANTAFPHW